MKVLNEKYLLKRCVNGLIPQSIKKRSKQPYRAPEGKCFLGGKDCEYVRDLLSPRRLESAGIFTPAAVGKLLEKFERGAAIGIKDNMALVGIISTQLVQDLFIDNFRSA
jgi:asparagine synthase (glutamine-hydrolysing)